MKNRSRWVLWGSLGAAGIVAAVLSVVLWGPAPSRLPADAIFIPRDVPSLQEALDGALPGATIAIQASDIPILGPISIDVPDITLVSSGGRVRVSGMGENPAVSIRADGVTVRGFDLASESIGLQVNASDCTIEDLQVESTPTGIQINYASRCVLRSVEVRAAGTGVELIGSSSTSVENLAIDGSSDYGIRLIGSWNNSLANLALSENAVGISIEEASTDNVIEASVIESCSIAGIVIRSSNDNTLIDNALDSARIGIMLERVTGVEIRDCEVARSTESSILLQQAVQNRVLETRIEQSQGSGIELTQSAENTLSSNQIVGCREGGIHLINSGKNLIMGNEVDSSPIGIHIERSDDNRVLRNRVSNAQLCGYLMSSGTSNRLLDNASIGGSFGMVLAEADRSTLLRNLANGADRAGLCLISTGGENYVSENELRACTWGLLLAETTHDRITQNQVLGNDIGMLLIGLGSGTRIEGNTIADNEIGLKQQGDLGVLEDDLAALGIVRPQNTISSIPILTNNMFANNTDYDIQNETVKTLLAAGNWWGSARVRDPSDAVVSDGVSLEQSAWKGTVAVGTGSDDVRILLGRILQWTLAEEGFRVIDLVGMGPSERVQQAIIDADVDLIWWSGTDLALATPIVGSASVVVPTPALEGWSIIVSAQLANRLAEPTVSSLVELVDDTGEQFRYAATSMLAEESFQAFLEAYALAESNRSFIQAENLAEVEALLKFGAVDVVFVGSLEETLTLAGFQAIEDEHQVLESNSISMIVQQSLTAKYPEAQDILVMLADQLTSEVLHDLMRRIRALHKEPEDVAREYLQQ